MSYAADSGPPQEIVQRPSVDSSIGHPEQYPRWHVLTARGESTIEAGTSPAPSVIVDANVDQDRIGQLAGRAPQSGDTLGAFTG